MIRENFFNEFKKFDFNDLTHNVLNGSSGITHTDLRRINEGKLGGQFWAAYASCNTSARDATRHFLGLNYIYIYL